MSATDLQNTQTRRRSPARVNQRSKHHGIKRQTHSLNCFFVAIISFILYVETCVHARAKRRHSSFCHTHMAICSSFHANISILYLYSIVFVPHTRPTFTLSSIHTVSFPDAIVQSTPSRSFNLSKHSPSKHFTHNTPSSFPFTGSGPCSPMPGRSTAWCCRRAGRRPRAGCGACW